MVTKELNLPVVLPIGQDCERCTFRLQEALCNMKGVARAQVNQAHSILHVTYDPNIASISRIETEARRIGAGISERIDHQTMDLRDLDCPDCAASLEKAVGKLPGVLWVSANYTAGQLFVELESGANSIPAICKTIEAHGISMRSIPTGSAEASTHPTASTLGEWIRHNRKVVSTATACTLTLIGALFGLTQHHQAATALYAVAILTGGWSTARAAITGLRERNVDMNLLMTTAVIGAAAIGDWFEGATVVALFNIGNLLQAMTMERTRRSIRSLINNNPKMARVRRDGVEIEIGADGVCLGDTVIVKPGERIAADGVVTHGITQVSEAMITGESLPTEKGVNSKVYAGTLNCAGYIEFTAICEYRDTTLAKIIHRVEEAQAQRAPSQQFVDRFAARYTPIVVTLAALIAVVPPLFQGDWRLWFVRALSLLIIACPCALIISTPVAFVTAIGNASRHGALIKGGQYLEKLGSLRAVLYDKTGTLTLGQFRVEEVVPLNGVGHNDVLRIAAALEHHSAHPLAEAFTNAAEQADNRPLPPVTEFQSITGQGIRGCVDGETYMLGKGSIADETKAQPIIEKALAQGKTPLLLSKDSSHCALFVLADTTRDDIKQTVTKLRALGLSAQAIVTGDNANAAQMVADAAGITDVKSGLLPDEKLQVVRDYHNRFGSVAMVGDGVNDGPALAAADVGIAMGAAGSDTALETADIALLADDLTRLPYLIRLSRQTRVIVRQNVAVALGTKGLLVIMAVTIGLPLWSAVVGDVGVSLLVTLNAMRLREF